MKNTQVYHPLENIEDVEEFYAAIDRQHLTRELSKSQPYTYWTMEIYDQENGIRGGGGLGVLAADTRRVAESMEVPLTLITPFYPIESKQIFTNGTSSDEHIAKNYADYGFKLIDKVDIKCCGTLCFLDVIEKQIGSTRILCITEPNFGELYSGESGGDHRLYQEVSLGFGGYQALKLAGLKPAIMQLNEVVTFFAALARLDELVANGMNIYEAIVYTRKHTLYTNHTLVQAAEAEFTYAQFERFVFPNLKSKAVKQWLSDKFSNGRVRLSTVTIEIAELKSGVSKLHARVANYSDLAGNKVKFKAITNGIDLKKWLLPEALSYYSERGIIDKFYLPSSDYQNQIEQLDASTIRELKRKGRQALNEALAKYPDQYGNFLHFGDNDFIFDFKRRFADYKRPTLPFEDLNRFKRILESHDAHYILSGRVHSGDNRMMAKLQYLLHAIDGDPFLKSHVHYIPNYNEEIAYGLSAGSNASINVPIVGLEACGTSWMKDVGNLCLLISTHDGGVADGSPNSYLNVSGENENEELNAIYNCMEEALRIWDNDFDLEFSIKHQLAEYLPVISGTRMLKDYLSYLFKPKN